MLNKTILPKIAQSLVSVQNPEELWTYVLEINNSVKVHKWHDMVFDADAVDTIQTFIDLSPEIENFMLAIRIKSKKRLRAKNKYEAFVVFYTEYGKAYASFEFKTINFQSDMDGNETRLTTAEDVDNYMDYFVKGMKSSIALNKDINNGKITFGDEFLDED